MGLSTIAYLFIGIIAVIAVGLLLRSSLGKSGSGNIPAPGKPESATVRTPGSGKSQPPAPKKRATSQNPYRATSIVAGPNACDAVKSLGKKRFLVAANEVPPLPLPNCNQPKCTCKYAHHADRREEGGDDRRGPPGLRSELHSHTGKSERRTKKRGRRSTDWE